MKTIKRKFLFILIIFTVGCATVYNPATEREEVYFINDEQEVSIGANLAESIKKENELFRNPNYLSDLIRIGQKLVTVSDRDYLAFQFYIINDEEMNAFALPGGYIFVNKGLIDKTNEDELAFVLAHEIGHVAARHSVKRLQASLGFSLILSIALKDVKNSIITDAVDIVYNVVSLGYSRQDEFLADSLAVKYTKKAGFNPRAGVSLMEKLQAEAKGSHTLVFLSSHPPAAERIKNIEERIQKSEDRSQNSD